MRLMINNFYESNNISVSGDFLDNITKYCDTLKKPLWNMLEQIAIDNNLEIDYTRKRIKFNFEYELIPDADKVRTRVMDLLYYHSSYKNVTRKLTWDGDLWIANNTIDVLPQFENEKDLRFISQEQADFFNQFGDYKARQGHKLSKLLNTIISDIKGNPRQNEGTGDYYYCPPLEDLTKIINQYYTFICDNLQVKTLATYMWLSVGAYDFVSMSNGNSWTSCHFVDGCHQSGASGYANDTVTLIAYQENEHLEKITRKLYFANELYLGWSKKVYGNNIESLWNKFDSILQEILQGTNIIEHRYYDANFNSGDSTVYPDWQGKFYSFIMSKYNPKVLNHYIGGYGICIDCGEEHNDPEDLSCCNSKSYCDCCEERVYYQNDDMTYISGVGNVCPNCLDNYFTVCNNCGEFIPNGDMIEYSGEYNNLELCDDCYNDLMSRLELLEDKFNCYS